MSLDGGWDLTLDIRISPELSAQVANEALTKYFHDERGWTEVALVIKGPAGDVTVFPASSTIKHISEMIIDIMLKKDEADSVTRQEKKKALEELLKGMGKKSQENNIPQ